MIKLLYNADALLIGAVSLPFLAAALILVLRSIPRSQEIVILASSCALLPILCRLYALCANYQGNVALHYVVTSSLNLVLRPEALGMVFALMVALLWLAANVYTISYMNKTDIQNRGCHPSFYACFSASIGCTLCVAFSGNIATLFIAYELLTVCTYPLIIHGLSERSVTGGRFYLKTLLCSSMLFLLPAVIMICGLNEAAGSFSTKSFISETHATFIPILLILLCYGVAKAAIVPAHVWLPRAMVAPTPVSALLHAVAVVKSGVFTIVKITVYALGVRGMGEHYATMGEFHHNILMYLSAVTVIAGSAMAMRQNNLKGLLAYSTVSQLSYVTLAVSMYTDGAIRAAILHMVCHAFAKITLFFAVGAVYASTGKTTVEEIGGIGRTMPVTATAFCIGALAMIGVPPAATFWSKFSVLSEATGSGHFVVVLVVVASTLLNTLYFAPIIYGIFFTKPEAQSAGSEASLPMLIAMTATSACTVALFIQPDIVFKVLDHMKFVAMLPTTE
ncbi:proton-conducting transporter transmembrane domain-containing protein [Anaplasma capra]|uniref:proton-conducting transporter transmembrane domain-containing protein n=1 Tax=Anaplasma capra TaxID=1562740 RepID=UPI0021D5E4AF|nr:proton-conducting transporter membrane subunit [Anaplasma capra]MCU7611697.1 proton-conducting transporter membrane subunit [Anaplasma capra]MCU7612553.1 proton-conducting transporter membrane subunit [Anaplasma capra]